MLGGHLILPKRKEKIETLKDHILPMLGAYLKDHILPMLGAYLSLDDMFRVHVSWQCKVCYKWVKAQYNEAEASPLVIA
jgi:hypothetical protein